MHYIITFYYMFPSRYYSYMSHFMFIPTQNTHATNRRDGCSCFESIITIMSLNKRIKSFDTFMTCYFLMSSRHN